MVQVKIEPDPATHPDLLGGAVLSSLTRPLYFPLSWGVLPSFLATTFTLGILPAFMIPRWLKGVTAQHEQQLWHLAEWLRLQTGSERASEMQLVSRKLRFNSTLAWVARLAAVLAVIPSISQAIQHPDVRSLVMVPFYFPLSANALIFTLLISTAAVSNWVHIISHQKQMAGYLAVFNQFALEQGLPPIPLPPRDFGGRPLWLIAAFSLLVCGMIWGFPMMLAMGAHRRYTMITSKRLRAQLAERMRLILNEKTPRLRVPEKPMTVLRLCLRRNCRAPQSFSAAYCQRCGSPGAEVAGGQIL